VEQTELFPKTAELPEGFVYQSDFISNAEEGALLQAIERIGFGEVRMHGVIAKRRVDHYGRSYEYNSAGLTEAPPIPEFLIPVRERVALFAGQTADEFAEALVTDYPEGAPIGWHRDAPPFDIIVGLSLLSDCTMYFRPWPHIKKVATRTKPVTQLLARRSAYILRGPSRTQWQHHIPPTKTRRVSITFRTLRLNAKKFAMARVIEIR
jgi:alkylated DNA repair dioxygenase AlkB